MTHPAHELRSRTRVPVIRMHPRKNPEAAMYHTKARRLSAPIAKPNAIKIPTRKSAGLALTKSGRLVEEIISL
jgi:hypothetical protein